MVNKSKYEELTTSDATFINPYCYITLCKFNRSLLDTHIKCLFLYHGANISYTSTTNFIINHHKCYAILMNLLYLHNMGALHSLMHNSCEMPQSWIISGCSTIHKSCKVSNYKMTLKHLGPLNY